jgi:beta-1,4-mannosyl-glycoprotein beta-1,4-N-acetylglucosaminyltransferase
VREIQEEEQNSFRSRDILLLTSDVDEIPRAHFMRVLSACQLPVPFPSLVLVCASYYYSFEFRRKGDAMVGPTVSLLMANRTNRSLSPSGKILRDERFGYQHMPSACYHCSWCFDQINLTRTKMASYSHTEHDRAQFQTQEHILTRYRHGKDLFDRPGEEYVRIENNAEVPELVKAQKRRFLYMTNRSALVNDGFRDI